MNLIGTLFGLKKALYHTVFVDVYIMCAWSLGQTWHRQNITADNDQESSTGAQAQLPDRNNVVVWRTH
jgi:hypothetical protein